MSIFINFLTISRIFCGIVIFLLIMLKDYYLLALLIFIFTGLTDYLDGYLARKYKKVSIIGEILDPIADKILVLFIFFALSVNLSSFFIAFLSATIIAREIWVAALRDMNSRYHNSAATQVTFLAKIKTTLQLFTISIYLFGLLKELSILILFADILLLISALVTIYTGYLYTLNSLKVRS